MWISLKTGISLAVRRIGEGPRNVLVVHGWMVTSAVYDALSPLLEDPTRSLWVPDLRGAGESDAPGHGHAIADHAADLRALLDALGLQAPTILAHSMGGTIALALAAADPERVARLVLLDPVPPSGLPLADDAVALFRAAATDRRARGAILDQACRLLDADAREALLDSSDRVSAAAILQGFTSWSAGVPDLDLGAIEAPVDVIATSDPFLSPELLQSSIVDRVAHGRLHRLEGPGHYPHVEAPERTAALVDRLLGGGVAGD